MVCGLQQNSPPSQSESVEQSFPHDSRASSSVTPHLFEVSRTSSPTEDDVVVVEVVVTVAPVLTVLEVVDVTATGLLEGAVVGDFVGVGPSKHGPDWQQFPQ